MKVRNLTFNVNGVPEEIADEVSRRIKIAIFTALEEYNLKERILEINERLTTNQNSST